MFQLSSDHWIGAADSVSNHIKGFSRGANLYVMMDKPFKGNPGSAPLSVSGSAPVIFSLNGWWWTSPPGPPVLPFYQLDTASNFKKFKVTTAYLEVPIELRFTSRPDEPNKSFKFAAGLKLGTC